MLGKELMACVECVAGKKSKAPLRPTMDVGVQIDMCVMSPLLLMTEGDIAEFVSILRDGILKGQLPLLSIAAPKHFRRKRLPVQNTAPLAPPPERLSGLLDQSGNSRMKPKDY
jgi:hypothetical protein